ncbi:MAG: PaaI family thioesterase [Ardenticatenaceae bacterium]|nr:PaaI family thioesterase [Ardenticatenaceae bacterium]
MTPQNPNYQSVIRGIFAEAGFISELGVELREVGPGWCETALAVAPRHWQQNGFIHAGVQATMADHTAGAAAATLMAAGQMVLTVEFKINLLRPAVGEQLRCRAEVVKAGKRISFVEAAVYASDNDESKLVAKLAATMTFVPVL